MKVRTGLRRRYPGWVWAVLLAAAGGRGEGAPPSTLEPPPSEQRQNAAVAAFSAEKDRLKAQLAPGAAAFQTPAWNPLKHFIDAAGGNGFLPGPFLPPPVGSVRQPFRNPPEIDSVGGVLDATLEARYADNVLWSSQQNTDVPVHLRSFNGGLVGPLLRMKPGDLLRLHVVNHLPPDANEQPPPAGMMAMPGMGHGFNTTNVHTHGLHVSPTGNSDNVFVEIAPGGEFINEFQTRADHPAGTFWYHSHVHGCTAVQVSSGMAGPLIVAGGLDEVPEIKAAGEKVFMFQQIPRTFDDERQAYVVEDFWKSFGPGIWAQGVHQQGWRTTINGQTVPVITMRPGEVQRWRLLHAGVQETLSVQLEGHALYEIARDGFATGKMMPCDTVELQPGYRSDVLVKADAGDAGKVFVLIDASPSPGASLLGGWEAPGVLAAVVVVQGAPVAMDLPPAGSLAGLAPFKPITDAELTGGQRVEFDVDTSVQPARMLIDGKLFDPAGAARTLKLNTAEEWTLTSRFANHPFHIHTNPFQVVSLVDDTGHETLTEPFWKDTLLVNKGWTIKVRMRYLDYAGKFVLHCHILDHEDRGMMQAVEILP